MAKTGSTRDVSEIFQEVSPKAIRNVCIIAHVDHGKTTVADALIAANGIISRKLRLMDSRDDEQERGITMKSSVVTLWYDPLLVNLIDSPGHVDFTAEVNSAVNVSDVALLVVDVLEGVCSQTESLLRQAVMNQVQVVLLLNKFDRLITELKLSEAEAFRHIQRLIENVNSVLSQIFQGLLLEEHWEKIDDVELRYHFNPTSGNVLFASAATGYAFSVRDFAEKWSSKLKLETSLLEANLFGDCFFAGGKIQHDAEAKGKKSLFEQLVLKPLWELYAIAFGDKDVDKLKVVAEKLGLPQIKAKRLDDVFSEIMRTWIPLSNAVIRAIASCQSPQTAFSSESRISQIFTSSDNTEIASALKTCNPQSDFLLLLVMKFVVIDRMKLAVVRVMNGTLVKSQELFPITENDSDSVRVISVHIMFGKDLTETESAVAGSVVAIAVDQFPCSKSLSNKRIHSTGLCFKSNTLEPLVRVTLRTEPHLVNQLKDCLRHISSLDSSVRVFEQDDGDLALVTAGEVHLQKCLHDLAALNMNDVVVSEPIVPFFETTVADPHSSYAKLMAMHATECHLKQVHLRFKIRCVPLSEEVINVMKKYESQIRITLEDRDPEVYNRFLEELKEAGRSSLSGLKGTWWNKKSADEVSHVFDKAWSFGPNRAKFNILFKTMENGEEQLKSLERSINAGFELAMSQGPLCDEPVYGVGVLWEDLSVYVDENDPEVEVDLQDPQLQGQLISATKQTIRAALAKTALRLVTPMYKCKVQTTANALGKVHTVLSQRHAKVFDEDINQTTGFFEIQAFLPVAESFDFCEQLRKRTSGVASAQMHFSHWQTIEEDPSWQPTTEEELEEFGEKGDTMNMARVYMNNVRRRKGLPTDEVLVISAEKQRNLKRNR